MDHLSVIVMLVALGVAHARFDWEKAEKDFNACKAETKAKETFDEIIKQSKNPETHEGKCLLECLLRSKGIYDKNGKYSPSGTQKYFSDVFSHKPEIIPKVVKDTAECEKINVKGMDKCDAAFEKLKCASTRFDKPNINVADAKKAKKN